LADSEEIIQFMESAVQNGKIRGWGIAYKSPTDHQWGSALPCTTMQFEGNLLTTKESAPLLRSERQRIITRPFCGGLNEQVMAQVYKLMPEIDGLIAEAGLKLEDLALAVSLRLAGPQGSVIAGMYNKTHIQRNSALLQSIASSNQICSIVDTYMSAACHPCPKSKNRPTHI
jgi:aryl-alcohol dehydrogenase-like predicted oxidoreductase